MNLDYLINAYKLDIGILKNKEISCENFLYLIGEKMGEYKKVDIVDLDKCAIY